jgi:hypothetical protein
MPRDASGGPALGHTPKTVTFVVKVALALEVGLLEQAAKQKRRRLARAMSGFTSRAPGWARTSTARAGGPSALFLSG